MTRVRQMPIFRELKGRDLLLLREKLVFLDLQLFDFRVQRRSGNSEFRCRTFRASDFPLAFSQCGFNDFSLLILEGVWQTTWQFLPGWLWAGQPSLFDPKGIAAAQDHRSLNDVLQLTDISRPGIRLAQFKRIRVDCANLLSGFLRVALYEVFDQHRNILSPFAERRHLNRKNVEPIKQVCAKRPRSDRCHQVTVGRGYNANIGGEKSVTSNPFKLVLLKHAEQCNLCLCGKLTDLV